MRQPYILQARYLFEAALKVRVLHCGRYHCPPEWGIEPTRLPSELINFFFVEKNECWSEVNGRRRALKTGDMLLCRSGDIFAAGHERKKPLTVLSICIGVEEGSLSNVLLDRVFKHRYSIRNRERYITLFENILKALESPLRIRNCATVGALLNWLVFLEEETAAPLKLAVKAPEDIVDKIVVAQEWGSARLASVISLEKWACTVGWHPVYFIRVFKRETGLSPMQWLKEKRMNAARQYLTGTGKTVAEIAEAVGYPDAFHFSRLFKKYFGKSPLQYRKSGWNDFGIFPAASKGGGKG